MSLLAPTLEAYFTERLIGQRRASPHTVASYRDTFGLLLAFAQQETGRPPSRLQLEDLDAPLIGAFLEHLETTRQTAPGPATPDCPRCTRCSASRHSGTPSTPR